LKEVSVEVRSSTPECKPEEEITIEITGAKPNTTLLIFPRIEAARHGAAAPAKHLLPKSVFIESDGTAITVVKVPKDIPYKDAELVLHIQQINDEHTLRVGIVEE
jgi:hypothetical protein